MLNFFSFALQVLLVKYFEIPDVKWFKFMTYFSLVTMEIIYFMIKNFFNKVIGHTRWCLEGTRMNEMKR